MCPLTLPEPVAALVTTLAALLDARQTDLLTPLFQGILFAHGRRTATSWFRAGDLADRSTYFRNDLVRTAFPGAPANPHTFLTNIANPSVAALGIGFLAGKAIMNILPRQYSVLTRSLVGYGVGLGLIGGVTIILVRYVVH